MDFGLYWIDDNVEKEGMKIFSLFIQHIIYSLSEKGKAAVVLPTGFLSVNESIEKKIRTMLINEGILSGIISMPSNIFASTTTNVSVVFIDREHSGDIMLIDAGKLGETVKDGNNQKTVLTHEEENLIISAFNTKKCIEKFSVAVPEEKIKLNKYSLSPGQYFDVRSKHVEITENEFSETLKGFKSDLTEMFLESKELDKSIILNFVGSKPSA